MKFNSFAQLALSGLVLLTACSKTGSGSVNVEDDSSTGAVAGLIGGALSNSNSSGSLAVKNNSHFLNQSFTTALETFIPPALASNTCPLFTNTNSSACTSSTNHLWLSYSACSFPGSTATWSGTQLLQMSTGTAACGTFPNPGASASLVRQFVNGLSSTTPSTATRTNSYGTVITIDDASSNLNNFDNHAVSTLANGGYGTKIDFNGSGARSSVTIARRVYSTGRFDHSITGTLSISESSSAATSRTLSGSLSVYHNALKVIGTSVFNSVGHSNTCCVPVSGSITTTFSAGSASPTVLGSRIVGLSETLTFTGCGTGTLQGTDGAAINVSLGNCI